MKTLTITMSKPIDSPPQVCKRCGVEKPATSYWFDARSEGRLPAYQKTCKDCKNLQKRVRRAAAGSRHQILKTELQKILGYQESYPEFNSLLETKLMLDRDLTRNENCHFKVSEAGLVFYCSRCLKFETSSSNIDLQVLEDLILLFKKHHHLCPRSN